MIRHISAILFLIIIKTTEAYSPYPECLETDEGCDPYPEESECERNKEIQTNLIITASIVCGLFFYCFLVRLIVAKCFESDTWINRLVEEERNMVHRKLYYYPRFYFFTLLLSGACSPIAVVTWLITLGWRKEDEGKLKNAIKRDPIGTWKEHKNMNLLNKGSCMLVENWRQYTVTIAKRLGRKIELERSFYNPPIEDLKRIVEYFGYSAITVYDDFDHAILRKFNNELTVDDCEPTPEYNCSTFIYHPSKTEDEEKLARERESEQKKKEEEEKRKIEEKKRKVEEYRKKAEQERKRLEEEKKKAQAKLPDLERIEFENDFSIEKVKWNSTGWKEYKNMNMFKQGGAKLIYNWRTFYSITDLQAMVEQNGYSAVTIYPDYDHAVLRKFDYQLTVDHCGPAQGYNCSTFIFTPPKQHAITIEPVEHLA